LQRRVATGIKIRQLRRRAQRWRSRKTVFGRPEGSFRGSNSLEFAVIFLYSLDCVRLIFNDFGSALFDGIGRDHWNLILIRWIKASVKDSEWGAISILTMPDGRSL
jgi:hypothetical protein